MNTIYFQSGNEYFMIEFWTFQSKWSTLYSRDGSLENIENKQPDMSETKTQ